MSYSGTTNQTAVNVDQLIAYSFRDCGKQAEEMTPELVNTAKQALFYILQNSVNRGPNLWLLQNVVLGAQSNQQTLSLPTNTIDVLEANWVYIQTPQISSALPTDNSTSATVFDGNLNGFGTSTTGENYFGASYGQATSVYYVGFNAYSPTNGSTATYNLAYETSNDGVTWTAQFQIPTTTVADKQWTYVPVNITQGYYYHRLRETVATTFSVRQIVFAQSQQVIPLARLNRDDYWNLPNKQFPSVRSLQYWFNRTIDPQMYLWPVPSNDFQVFQLVLETQPQDVGSLTNQLYLPNRWLPYIQAELSYKMAFQLPDVDSNRRAELKALSLQMRTEAEEEDRDKSPIYFQPNFSYYSR